MNSDDEIRRKLHDAALAAPKTPGVYMWKDSEGVIIYIGKAKSLKNRLSSYFSSSKDIKTRILISRASQLEYIDTENEYEALILENNLIKKHKPRYNINLKDGKTYPFIRVTNEDFPRIYRTRRIREDGSRYFGPFPDVGALDVFLDFIGKTYPVRKCRVLRKQDKPCLYYHIKQCAAPCCGKISKEDYAAFLDEALLYLRGGQDSRGGQGGGKPAADGSCAAVGAEAVAGLDTLVAEMKKAASMRLFEKAARIRDGIRAIETLRERNSVEDMDPTSRDYIAWAEEGSMISFAVLRMRSGKLVGRELFRTRTLKEAGEILPEFLMSFYTDKAEVPPCIFVPDSGSIPLAEEWLRRGLRAPARITAVSPDGWNPAQPGAQTELQAAMESDAQGRADGGARDEAAESGAVYASDARKRHLAAMNMAFFNAREDAARRLKEHGDFPALEELQRVLGLSAPPSRIEGFDIAHIGGRLPVASLISFKDGNPDKKNYRYFRLRTTDGVIDDFASIREAVSRRYTRLLNEHAELPDLVLIDGGIGQVNAAHEVLSALGLDLPVAGLAKQEEEIYRPGNSVPLRLPRRSDALRLLQRVRDETHRFATGKNQRLRTKENVRLVFEDIPGVGPALSRKLLALFGGLEKAAECASKPDGASELAASLKLPQERAEQIAAGLRALAEERRSRLASASQPADASGSSGTSGVPGKHPAEGLSPADLARLAGAD